MENLVVVVKAREKATPKSVFAILESGLELLVEVGFGGLGHAVQPWP